ncbi:FHA domain-containing protein [Diaminobutyricimonas aerilata]|uniref:FHA domain-containing protein n=1 Tax=Diaminobutyricimonas aerilata TaxID=1162967 RepID=A0A2M9CIG1_9MICO|nr:FHA domain-containing protein [Diaminobutyricimonas aerilata]PJJ71678.1 FHA domain-containing protein [Diaminobutyricimonas aerilata]
MSDAEKNPFLITPPPGLIPAADPDVDSGTRRSVPAPRIAAPLPPFFPGQGVRATLPQILPPGSPAAVEAERVAAEGQPDAVDPDPAAPETPPATPVVPIASWVLRLPDSTERPLPGTVVLGRNPSVPPNRSGATVLPLDDPARSVSKTHALLEPTVDGLLVHDLNSTNGVVVVDPDGTSRVVEPGHPQPVASGGAVELGSYVVRLARS